jgi:hypothetical protein
MKRWHSIILNISIFFISSAVCFLVGIFLLKQVGIFLGANIEYNYECEPKPHMWMVDSLIGYRNKPNINYRVFGNVTAITNNFGFRSPINFNLNPAIFN